jgi:hypothetical protein
LIRTELDEIDKNTGDINEIDEIPEQISSDPSQILEEGPKLRGKLLSNGHITLRSRQPPVSLSSKGDSFRTQLSNWLAYQLRLLDISLPHAVNFGRDDLVSDFCASCMYEQPFKSIQSRLPNIDPSGSSMSPKSTSIPMKTLFIAAPNSTTKSDAIL